MKQVESNGKQLSAIIETLKLFGVKKFHRNGGNLLLPNDQVIKDENEGKFSLSSFALIPSCNM